MLAPFLFIFCPWSTGLNLHHSVPFLPETWFVNYTPSRWNQGVQSTLRGHHELKWVWLQVICGDSGAEISDSYAQIAFQKHFSMRAWHRGARHSRLRISLFFGTCSQRLFICYVPCGPAAAVSRCQSVRRVQWFSTSPSGDSTKWIRSWDLECF